MPVPVHCVLNLAVPIHCVVYLGLYLLSCTLRVTQSGETLEILPLFEDGQHHPDNREARTVQQCTTQLIISKLFYFVAFLLLNVQWNVL